MVCPNCSVDNCVNNHTCIQCEQELIGEEIALMEKIVEVWNCFTKLKSLHPDEHNEFRILIHNLQDKVSYRIAKKVTVKDNIFI